LVIFDKNICHGKESRRKEEYKKRTLIDCKRKKSSKKGQEVQEILTAEVLTPILAKNKRF
jgi:hypothetical protein